jgi:hypothetical protein
MKEYKLSLEGEVITHKDLKILLKNRGCIARIGGFTFYKDISLDGCIIYDIPKQYEPVIMYQNDGFFGFFIQDVLVGFMGKFLIGSHICNCQFYHKGSFSPVPCDIQKST